MISIEDAIATLGIPGSIAVVIVIIFAVLQLIGEFIESIGKVSPAILNIRMWMLRRNAQRKAREQEIRDTLTEVKTLLSDVNTHYSADNIAKRDEWMEWVNNRAIVYDSKVAELIELKAALTDIAESLKDNTCTTDNLYKESCRTTIINFSHIAGDLTKIISEEEFKRVQKVYEEYETFLAARNEPNGQVETCYSVIQEAYTERLRTHNFLEYMRDTTN